MATKKEIIIKWIRHTPLLRLDECVDNAMEEYAKQECAAKDAEIERLKKYIAERFGKEGGCSSAFFKL